MFRCSPRPGTDLSQARQLYCLLPFVFIAFMPFKNIGTNLACGSRCIARCSTSIRSFAGQAQAKSAASAPSDTEIGIVFATSRVLNPAQFSSVSSPASNAACSVPRISASPALLLLVFWAGSASKRVPQPAHTSSGKIRSIVSRILMFSPFGEFA